jgi:hypothetical protein
MKKIPTTKTRADIPMPVLASGPALFGCEPLFDICTDAALMSLSLRDCPVSGLDRVGTH